MNKQPTKLTKEVLDGLPLAASGQYAVRDTEEPGFFVVVGSRTKTFTVQVDVPNALGQRKTRKQALGRWPEVSCVEARRLARRAKEDLRRGGAKAKEPGLTLGEAWQALRAELEEDVAEGRRSARTVETYGYGAKLLGDWMDVRLAKLSDEAGSVVPERQRELRRKHGPGAAEAAMVFLRRTYNNARKRQLERGLPAYNPVEAVKLRGLVRRDTAMSAEELPGWHRKLMALPNPVRREFHLFCLLSGSRPGALTVARWEHLDVKRRRLRVPNPKGGRQRAFDIPLSREMLACLARARRAGRMVSARNAAEWIFPGDLSRSHRTGGPATAGHMVEYREDREVLPKWGGDLRQTYATLAVDVGLSQTDLKLMLNHASGDVTTGYITRDKVAGDYLRAQQEAMSRYIMGWCRKRG